MSIPKSHPSVNFGKTATLIVNLGTPTNPTAKALKPYLKEFLSDRRVIEASPLIWQPILRGIILNTRPRKSAKAYAKIWHNETDESPLRYYTRRQSELLQKKLKGRSNVFWAMRYGKPSIDDTLKEMRAAGFDRISVIALYPHYSASTSASVYDHVFRALMRMRWQPAIRTAPPWHDHPVFIEALEKSLKKHMRTLSWKPDKIILSYHGLPQAYFDKGDPYHCHCQKTTRLLREKMGYTQDQMISTFQSRFGPTKWLEPYTDKTVEELGQTGVEKILVMTPGFISDCVETLEEIAIELKETFLTHNGTHFSVVPCLNDTPQSIDLLKVIAENEVSGW